MKISITDQLGNKIVLNQAPQRIISLVPSITDYLYYLKLNNKIVAQTIFCIHPALYFKNATKIGGTKKLQIQKIKALKPDLVIANKEENVKEQIEQLQQFAPVYISDVNTLPQAIEMMQDIAILTQTLEIASPLIKDLNLQLDTIHNQFQGTFIYLIWNNPYYAVGPKTYIHELLQHLGLQNVLSTIRYPQLSLQQIQALAPAFLFLSTEPFPFQKEHVAALQAQLPNTQVCIINGEVCSWYGSRMAAIQSYFTQYFNAP